MADGMLRLFSLEQIAPALSGVRPVAPRSIDWGKISRILGVALPRDYVELAEAYPAIEFDGFLCVWVPRLGGEEEFVAGLFDELELVAELQEEGEAENYVAHPEPGGLIPWGSSLDGDVFYWCVIDGDPDGWPVVAHGRNGSWWECQSGLIRFLVGVVTHDVDRGELSDDVLGVNPSVVLLGD
ncbi:hypothetical protein [Streptomyces sp. NBC_01262]|uniref:hypothetical protein n=1 Tax=Streptomyces sp. NBC_01262 TaxID=2903803 RepID=UPI002E331512|nr:hypothetical protein [Streptomyces sp. NBC_01262]